MWGNLSHSSIVPCLGICFQSGIMARVSPSLEKEPLDRWRSSNPSVSKIRATLLEVAKAIQYIHSLGTVLGYSFYAGDIYLDSDNHVKFQYPCFRLNDLCQGRFDYDGFGKVSTSEDDIHHFGLLIYEVIFNKRFGEVRPSEPEIPDNVWKLIQWCCASDPKKRPTIDQVVHELESWILLGQ
ncbi:Protein kinase-like domain containing protein [Amanita muscaria]